MLLHTFPPNKQLMPAPNTNPGATKTPLSKSEKMPNIPPSDRLTSNVKYEEEKFSFDFCFLIYTVC